MRDRTVNRVESWDARPFSGGFATLRDMSDANFSGVVVSGDAWLFMLNGRVVGIVDGDIDEFQDASGTMYEAPDPSLPLLFSMQERAGTTQAKYYTNDTALEEADRTLSDANFTGYVELSENVLSGDYYLVYYGGRMLPVAFVGASNELKTGDEAYDLATDEVGVYEVIKTPVNVTQVPAGDSPEADTDGSTDTGAGAGTAAGADATAAAGASPESDGEDGATGAASGGSGTDAVEDDSPAPSSRQRTEPDPEPSAEAAAREEDAANSDDAIVEAAEPRESTPSDAGPTEQSSQGESSTPESNPPESTGGATPASERSTESPPKASPEDVDGAEKPEQKGDDSSVFSEEEQWRQTKSIPSLSPSEREKRRSQQGSDGRVPEQQSKRPRSERPDGVPESAQRQSAEAGAGAKQADGRAASSQTTQSADPSVESTESDGNASETSGAASGSPADAPPTRQSGDSAASSEATDERIVELETRLEHVDAERDELVDDLESTRSERDELQKRVRQLENALEDAGGDATTGASLTPAEALAGTNLFVRYGSRGAPTLDDLTGKNPDAEAINKNLRIDHHTQFESKEAVVDGADFERFLERSSSFRFVSWLVRDLPYEVLDAGHRGSLGDLYEVIPEIDRAELQGVVEVETEDGDERREFDIVLRDRMGNPLVVAELNDERDPVSGTEMESLVESAQVVGEGADDLGAAFYVTASFFEPDALENAADATGSGGILSRSDRASYVKLARKHGFHLCLAEDRNDTFHLTVPEL